jgi:hypothetical protein
MEVLNEIAEPEEIPVEAKKLGYLISIIKQLGWNSFVDKRQIKPSFESASLYIETHKTMLLQLFGEPFVCAKDEDFIDILNSILLKTWHVQITGNRDFAQLQLLRKTK